MPFVSISIPSGDGVFVIYIYIYIYIYISDTFLSNLPFKHHKASDEFTKQPMQGFGVSSILHINLHAIDS